MRYYYVSGFDFYCGNYFNCKNQSCESEAIIISTVIFKLRVIAPRSRDAPARNMAHMEYIGRRKGVVLNEGMNHGLFGKILDKSAEEIPNIHDMSRYIADKTRNKTIVYRAVISLAEADAIRLGFDDRAKWQELIAAKMPDVAEKIGIPLHNLEYVAAVHMEKGHPHAHLQFWDKAQGVKNPYVHPSVANQIRAGLIKHIFAEEMSELQELKNEARKGAADSADGFFSGFLDTFAKMTPKEFETAKRELKQEYTLADGRLVYNKFPTAAMNELAVGLARLQSIVPKSGRLQMKLMPPEVKDEIRSFINELFKRNVDYDREFKKYINSAVELAKYYSDNPDAHAAAGEKAYNEMLGRLSNVVLRAIKKLNEQERDFSFSMKSENYRRQAAESLVTEIFFILSRSANAENNKVLNASRRFGDLSKQGKIELAKKFESDTGYDWER